MDPLISTNEIGEGFPVLVIHGWEMNRKVEELDLEPIFAKVSGFRRMYLDLPGMGTTPANGIKDLDDIFLRLVKFIDNRLGKSKFLLIGSSCGGYLVHALAQKYAIQVDGVFLRVPLVEPENALRDVDPVQPLVSNEQLMSRIPTDNKALLGDVLVQTPAYMKALKEKYETAILPALEVADKETLGPIREDPKRYKLSLPSENEQCKVFAPTLIICGRQDAVVGYRDSLPLLEHYPRSTYVVLDRGGHDLPIDQVGLFQALVHDWLVRVKEWQGNTDK